MKAYSAIRSAMPRVRKTARRTLKTASGRIDEDSRITWQSHRMQLERRKDELPIAIRFQRTDMADEVPVAVMGLVGSCRDKQLKTGSPGVSPIHSPHQSQS